MFLVFVGLPVSESGVLTALTITGLGLICLFESNSVYFIKLGTHMSGAHMFQIVISFNQY